MKALPFEGSKRRLLWKILLHTIEAVIYPILPIAIICNLFGLFEMKTVNKFSLVLIILVIVECSYVIKFFADKIRGLQETSDARRKLKYTLTGVLDSVPLAGFLFVLFAGYRTLLSMLAETENTVVAMTGIVNKSLAVAVMIIICKLSVIWLNALLVRYLEAADEDAERGYLLGKAFKYKDGGNK